jgi:hypothetical protein
MNVKLAYGIREGRIVHISELKPAEKGEKCNCTCPICRGRLVAKLKDDRRQRHFAHKISNKCDIVHAQQTGLHLLAKEIIQENSGILVPELAISRLEIVSAATDVSVAAEVDIELPKIKSCMVEYKSVDLEKSVGDIVADAVIRVDGKPCIVEVAVTHFVDEIKEKKIEALNLPAFEIDLSDLLEKPQTRESIAVAVLSDETNRHWICNPKRRRLLEEKRTEFQKKYNSAVQKRELAEKRKQEYKQKNLSVLQELMKPENYADELKQLRNDEQAAKWLKRFVFSKGLTEYPFYMDIPITGEFVFPCDRRIWQGKLFEDYVYRGFGQELCIFSISQIQRRISKGKLIIRYDWPKAYHTVLLINGQEREISFSYDVIQRYFDYLDLLGFVSHIDYEWYSRRPVSLEPPNQVTANVLKAVIESVDSFTPDIDLIIEEELLSRLKLIEQP